MDTNLSITIHLLSTNVHVCRVHTRIKDKHALAEKTVSYKNANFIRQPPSRNQKDSTVEMSTGTQ